MTRGVNSLSYRALGVQRTRSAHSLNHCLNARLLHQRLDSRPSRPSRTSWAPGATPSTTTSSPSSVRAPAARRSRVPWCVACVVETATRTPLHVPCLAIPAPGRRLPRRDGGAHHTPLEAPHLRAAVEARPRAARRRGGFGGADGVWMVRSAPQSSATYRACTWACFYGAGVALPAFRSPSQLLWLHPTFHVTPHPTPPPPIPAAHPRARHPQLRQLALLVHAHRLCDRGGE